MNWLIYIAIALTGAGTSLGMDTTSTGCGADVSAQDISRSVPALVAFLGKSESFQADAAALAARTAGQVRATNPDLREEIIGASASSPCQIAYALEQRAAINRHLGDLLPSSENNCADLRGQVEGRSAGKGIALVFHQKKKLQKSRRGIWKRWARFPASLSPMNMIKWGKT